MPKLSSARLVRRKQVAREGVAGLNLTQHAYREIIADIDESSEWDDNLLSNNYVKAFDRLFMELPTSCSGSAEDPLPSSDKLFSKLFVIWAMKNDVQDGTRLPRPHYIRCNIRPWWRDAMKEFLAMVAGQDVKIHWLDNLFQQFADEPPSKTKNRRQIANVAVADRPRLLRRTLVDPPPAAPNATPSREDAKRKQDSRDTSSSSSESPIKKIKFVPAKVGDQSTHTSGPSSVRTKDNTSLPTSQPAIGTSSSGALCQANFGLGLPNNFATSDNSLATQPGKDLVANPQTEPPSIRDPTARIDWHPKYITVKKERDDLASQLAKANEQLKEKEKMLTELRKDLAPFLDSAHVMLQGLNAIDLQREKMREAAVKLLSHSIHAPLQQAAASSTSTSHGDGAATTSGNADLQGRDVPGQGQDGTENDARQKAG